MFLVSPKVDPVEKQQFSLDPYLVSFLVFFFFAAIYILLRSQQYLAVDGALRCLEIYRRNTLVFYTNNHLWYQANILLWSRTMGWLGLQATNPFEFISLSQAMNSVASAGSVASLYLLLRYLTSSTLVSLAAVSAYGFSRAMLLHATNSAEPPVGLFYSALGMVLAVEGLRRDKKWLLMLAGASFSMALASYQSMILVAALAVFFCFGRVPADPAVAPMRTRLLRCGALAFGAGGAACAAYGWAYSQSGSTTLAQMVHRFVELQGGKEVYGYFSLAKFLNPPFGLIFALMPARPPHYLGIRSLLREQHNILWIGCLLALFIWLFLIFWSVSHRAIATWNQIKRSDRLLIFALLATLLILVGPLIYWDPLYDKLWLQPLAVIICLGALLYRIGFVPGRRTAATLAATCFIALEITLNLSAAVHDHRTPTEGISEARAVGEVVRPKDFIVLNFDGLSMLYLTLWGSPDNSLLLPASTLETSTRRMNEAIRKTHENGGAVYFLSVFDISEPDWNAFLGHRVGIPYDSFDEYRTHSTIVRSFHVFGQTTTLRSLR